MNGIKIAGTIGEKQFPLLLGEELTQARLEVTQAAQNFFTR